jgi:hypothetical protein
VLSSVLDLVVSCWFLEELLCDLEASPQLTHNKTTPISKITDKIIDRRPLAIILMLPPLLEPILPNAPRSGYIHSTKRSTLSHAEGNTLEML